MLNNQLKDSGASHVSKLFANNLVQYKGVHCVDVSIELTQ